MDVGGADEVDCDAVALEDHGEGWEGFVAVGYEIGGSLQGFG